MHKWNAANFDEMKTCLICGANKKYSSSALCVIANRVENQAALPWSDVSKSEKRIARLEAALRSARTTLNFYATAEYVDVKNRFMAGTPDNPYEELVEDDGTCARKALIAIDAVLRRE